MFYNSYEELPDEVKILVNDYDKDEDPKYLCAIRDLGYIVEADFGEIDFIAKDETEESIIAHLKQKWEEDG